MHPVDGDLPTIVCGVTCAASVSVWTRPWRRCLLQVARLEAALWASHDATDFGQAVLRAVNLGNDTDTTGAECGQLAGAYWGESGIPVEWRERLVRREVIEEAVEQLIAAAGA